MAGLRKGEVILSELEDIDNRLMLPSSIAENKEDILDLLKDADDFCKRYLVFRGDERKENLRFKDVSVSPEYEEIILSVLDLKSKVRQMIMDFDEDMRTNSMAA